MSGLEMTVDYPPSRFTADNNLSDSNVLKKYEQAANIANHVLSEVLSNATIGISSYDLCDYGDRLLEAYAGDQPSGIAFPTCVTVNDKIRFCSPVSSVKDDYYLKAGDVVKIELGAHIDGYIATAAHTTVLNPNPSQPVTGNSADVICAAHLACEAALSMMRPGVKSSEVTRVIAEIAEYFRCKPVEGTYSSMMKRHVLRAGNDIDNSFPENLLVKNQDKNEFQIEANQAYHLNIVLTTGSGQAKQSEVATSVFQRDVNKSRQLKLKAAREAYSIIDAKHTVFPFSSRSLTGSARLGLPSILKNELIEDHLVLRSASHKDTVAQYKATVLVIGDNDIIRTTLPQPRPFVHSTYCIPESTNAAQAIKASIVRTIAKAELPPVNVAFGEGRTQIKDVDMEMEATTAN